jgi:hypothetical protein
MKHWRKYSNKENRNYSDAKCFSAIFLTINHTWAESGLKPGPHLAKPTINYPVRDAAFET